MNPQNKTPSASAVPGMDKLRVMVNQPTKDLLGKVTDAITDAIDESLQNLDFSKKLDKLDKLDTVEKKLDEIRTSLSSLQQDLSTIKANYDQLTNALTTISWEDK